MSIDLEDGKFKFVNSSNVTGDLEEYKEYDNVKSKFKDKLLGKRLRTGYNFFDTGVAFLSGIFVTTQFFILVGAENIPSLVEFYLGILGTTHGFLGMCRMVHSYLKAWHKINDIKARISEIEDKLEKCSKGTVLYKSLEIERDDLIEERKRRKFDLWRNFFRFWIYAADFAFGLLIIIGITLGGVAPWVIVSAPIANSLINYVSSRVKLNMANNEYDWIKNSYDSYMEGVNDNDYYRKLLKERQYEAGKYAGARHTKMKTYLYDSVARCSLIVFAILASLSSRIGIQWTLSIIALVCALVVTGKKCYFLIKDAKTMSKSKLGNKVDRLGMAIKTIEKYGKTQANVKDLFTRFSSLIVSYDDTIGKVSFKGHDWQVNKETSSIISEEESHKHKSFKNMIEMYGKVKDVSQNDASCELTIDTIPDKPKRKRCIYRFFGTGNEDLTSNKGKGDADDADEQRVYV